ncbi:hypothetical protein A1Q1_04690 [Trichosporon asahii var. asahii CBS 2479]|uniref:Uncharacterized protein n=1 Tax=Trichosporon asahii var. asahii (strain ATCC 90039 / CBS 2479 / JCM 2466 / KCTC 7840 / NBRC 103889/ NCYC 2677 / UAMH 7654) TaxID=1186058 RepID=J4U8D3_TRIAS|nr:hypothetical protein A1Q1_04690 [Trichosporon asahii var. asahii CBS 2479]EJT46725.1 hypothetical protein A1Q1_04690 [Trichosporon asahii var. asahii CBS 2479]
MAEVAARKRARSSSPVCDVLASPLEVLLKRRRRDLSRTSSVALPPPSQPIFDPPGGTGGDTAMPSSSSPGGLPSSSSPGFENYSHDANSLRGIERRRTRNWERLNAPAHAGPSCEPDSSPVARRSMSDRHLVSSSPVRHQPPAPVFRDEWSAEERLREWGDEYASQNSVLHSLHLARLESQQSLHSLHSVASAAYSPFELTEPASSPAPMPSATPLRTPASANPWRTHQTPGFTPGGFTSSEYVSSPLFSPPPHSGPHHTHATPSRTGEAHGEVRASYEETNRLLAELNFARLRRHDAMSSSPPPPSTDPAMDEQW